MAKLVKLTVAAGLVAGGFWLAWHNDVLTRDDAFDVAKGIAEIVGVSPSAGADQLNDLPGGSRLIEIYRNVGTITELAEANRTLRAEVERLQSVAAAVSATQSAAAKSCTAAQRSAVLSPAILAERSKEITDALAEIDAWMLRVIEFAKESRPLELATAALRYREFGQARLEIGEMLGSISSLARSLPRLSGSCTLKIPPLRPEDRS
jgi:hypothetical protein